MKKRHRRHTIARPASALALVSDSSASEDSEDDHQFDRISDILSNLIQEANEAVSYDKKVSIPLIRKLSAPSSTMEVKPKKIQRVIPTRPVSYPSSSSFNVRRRSAIPITTTMATNKSNASGKELLESFKRLDSSMAIIDSLSRDLAPAEDLVVLSKKRSSVMSCPNMTTPTMKTKKNNGLKSMVMQTPFDSRLSALLLLPLLHVPHALISMVFDNMSSTNNDHSSNTSNLGGMVAWAFIFAITNLVMDKAIIITSPNNVHNKIIASRSVSPDTLNQPSVKKSLPGSFLLDRQQSKSNGSRKRPSSSNSNRKSSYKRRGSKQQFYSQEPKPLQDGDRQSTFNLPERKSLLSRRNSL
ncbi:unnamed protein product [Mucor hiemalis]